MGCRRRERHPGRNRRVVCLGNCTWGPAGVDDGAHVGLTADPGADLTGADPCTEPRDVFRDGRVAPPVAASAIDVALLKQLSWNFLSKRERAFLGQVCAAILIAAAARRPNTGPMR